LFFGDLCFPLWDNLAAMRCSRAIWAVVLLGAGVCAQETRSQKSAPLEAPSATLPAEFAPRAEQPRITLPSRGLAAAAKTTVPRIVLPPLSEAERHSIQNPPRTEKRTRVGVVRELKFSSAEQGARVQLEDGREVWMLEVVSTGATAVRLHITGFDLPVGAELFLAGGTGRDVAAFTGRGPLQDGDFWTPVFAGDTVRLELLNLGEGRAGFQVVQMGHQAAPEEQIQGCHLDATCYPDWAQAGDAVAMIQFTDGKSWYRCSASLLNNSTGDFSLLLLTANHCVGTEALAKTVHAEWFYRSQSCNANSPRGTVSTLTATLLATSTATDVTLLELLAPVPAEVTFAGWNAAPVAMGEDIASMHHPGGSYRRISFGSVLSDVAGFENYHRVIYSAGMAEPGSSGGPLFNRARQVVGQLFGGNATCSNTSGDALYGKLDISFPLLKSADGRRFLEQGLPDDPFSPNHARSAAKVLDASPGHSLVMLPGIEDWFEVKPPAHYLVTVREISAFPTTGFQMEVYNGAEESPRAVSTEFNQRPIVSFTATGDPASRKYLRVLPPSGGIRRRYVLEVAIAPPPTPTVSYGSYSVLGEHAARVEAWVDTRTDATLKVEYSTDPNFAQLQSIQVAVTGQQYTHGGVTRTVPLELTGLNSNTVYYFRLALDNGLTTVIATGEPRSFRTAAATIRLDKTSLDFGLQKARTTKFLPVKVTNIGSTRWEFSRFVIEQGYAFGNPWVVTHTCGTGLDPGKTCEVDVVLTPWYPGYYWSIVWIESNGVRTGIQSSGVGSGVLANIENAFDGNWQTNWANHLSKEHRYVVKPWGNEPLTLQGFTISAPFFISRNECPAVLAVGSSCYIYIRAVPPKVGDTQGDLRLDHSGLESPSVLRMMIWAQDLSLSVIRPRRPSRSASVGAQTFELSVDAGTEVRGDAQVECVSAVRSATCVVSDPVLRLNGSPARTTVSVGATRSLRLWTARSLTVAVQVKVTFQGLTKTIDVPVQVSR